MSPTIPTPTEIRSTRKVAGMTQEAAADHIYKSCRVWQMWEAGDRQMDPTYWELFLIKTTPHKP